MKRNLAFALVLALMFSLTACGGGSSALVGKWSLERVEPTRFYAIEDMELLKDGTGIVDGIGVRWKAENDHFYITNPSFTGSWSYKISGRTLTLTDDGGRSLTYKKESPASNKSEKELDIIGTWNGKIEGYNATVTISNLGWTVSIPDIRYTDTGNYMRDNNTGRFTSDSNGQTIGMAEALDKNTLKLTLNQNSIAPGIYTLTRQ
jgi:hypothetical protein